MRSIRTLSVACAALSVGCLGTMESTARYEASESFACFSDSLSVSSIGPGIYRVEGCGRQAVYACRMDPEKLPEPEEPYPFGDARKPIQVPVCKEQVQRASAHAD